MINVTSLGQDVIVKLLEVAKDAGDMEQIGVKINNNDVSLWMAPSSLLNLMEANHPDVNYTILAIR